MAAYPLAIWFDGELLLEGLLTFLVLLGFVLLLRSRDTDRQWWLPGIAFGLAAITRPNVLAFLARAAGLAVPGGKGFRGPRVPGVRSETRTPDPRTPEPGLSGCGCCWSGARPRWSSCRSRFATTS